MEYQAMIAEGKNMTILPIYLANTMALRNTSVLSTPYVYSLLVAAIK